MSKRGSARTEEPVEQKTDWTQLIGDAGEIMIIADHKKRRISLMVMTKTNNGYGHITLWITSLDQVEQLMLNLNSALSVAFAEEF